MSKFFRQARTEAGFTLIELLGVVAIIAVLAMIAVPTILKSVDDSKVGGAMQTAATIRSALIRAHAASITATNNGAYPALATATDAAGFATALDGYFITPAADQANYTFVSYTPATNPVGFTLIIKAKDRTPTCIQTTHTTVPAKITCPAS